VCIELLCPVGTTRKEELAELRLSEPGSGLGQSPWPPSKPLSWPEQLFGALETPAIVLRAQGTKAWEIRGALSWL
jgi:hypothetical protein